MHATQLPAALALQPELATVVIGINDVLRLNADLRPTGSHIADMFAALNAAVATVATFTFPDLSAVMPLANRLRRLNQLILAAAEEHRAVVADLRDHPFSADSAYWHADRIHGSSRGHQVVAATRATELGLPIELPLAPISPVTFSRRRAGLIAAAPSRPPHDTPAARSWPTAANPSGRSCARSHRRRPPISPSVRQQLHLSARRRVHQDPDHPADRGAR